MISCLHHVPASQVIYSLNFGQLSTGFNLLVSQKGDSKSDLRDPVLGDLLIHSCTQKVRIRNEESE